MLNTIITYFTIGVIFGIFSETVAHYQRKYGHQIDYLNNTDRVLIVLFWPVAALIFFESFWKNYNNKK